MHRIKPTVRVNVLFINCLRIQFLYGQCVFYSADWMGERKRIAGSGCLEMWSWDTVRLLLHRKGERFYLRTAFACPWKSCPKNHPPIGYIQIIVFQRPLCFQFIDHPIWQTWIKDHRATVGSLHNFPVQFQTRNKVKAKRVV